jgi:hypothetical protein
VLFAQAEIVRSLGASERKRSRWPEQSADLR